MKALTRSVAALSIGLCYSPTSRATLSSLAVAELLTEL